MSIFITMLQVPKTYFNLFLIRTLIKTYFFKKVKIFLCTHNQLLNSEHWVHCGE